MSTPNPLEQASIALSQIGLESGLPRVQQGLDHLASHLDMRALEADEQIAEGLPPENVLAAALHDAVTGAVLSVAPRVRTRLPLRLGLALSGVLVMWTEASLQPEPGIGFALATLLMIASVLFSDPETR